MLHGRSANEPVPTVDVDPVADPLRWAGQREVMTTWDPGRTGPAKPNTAFDRPWAADAGRSDDHSPR